MARKNAMVNLPIDLDEAIEHALHLSQGITGFLGEHESRFLALLAACTPAEGAIVEIGSFKGKSTVALASVAARYGFGPVVAIDPHTAPSPTDPDVAPGASSFDEFTAAIRGAKLEKHVEVHRTVSREVAKNWSRPIRLLWIDGEHTYKGAKEDFDLFSPYLSSGAIVALHDALHSFEGPIRVFVEEILRSDRFGAAGFVQSIAWGQFRPDDGVQFRAQREQLAKKAARLLPFVRDSRPLHGLTKLRYKLARSRVPRGPISATQWSAQLTEKTPK